MPKISIDLDDPGHPLINSAVYDGSILPYWSIPPWMIGDDLLDRQIIAQDEDYELL